MRRLGALILLVLAAACSSATNGSGSSPEDTDALTMMSVAFDGSYSRAEIKERLEQAMNLYDLALTEENYSRAGSALVALRQENGVLEMDILAEMIHNYVPGLSVSFPSAAGLAAASLATSR